MTHSGQANVAGLKKRGVISGQFAARLIEMLKSPAYRALSLWGHRALARIEIENAAHGGQENGRLPVTFSDFEAYGIPRRNVLPTLQEIEHLGFAQITEHGKAGDVGCYRTPNRFRLTYVFTRTITAEGRLGGIIKPTDNWRRITAEKADHIAKLTRAAVQQARGKDSHKRILKDFRPVPHAGTVHSTHAGTVEPNSPVPPAGTTRTGAHAGTAIYNYRGERDASQSKRLKALKPKSASKSDDFDKNASAKPQWQTPTLVELKQCATSPVGTIAAYLKQYPTFGTEVQLNSGEDTNTEMEPSSRCVGK